jgi:phosphocarrier protein
MTSASVTVPNALGMHARAAARFVHAATAYQAQIRLSRGTHTVDGKSIMGVLLLAAARGTVLEIAADGPDEADAVAALVQLIQSGLGE